MKGTTLPILVLTSVLLLGGCATQRAVNTRLDEPWRVGFTPDSYGALPARSPENCHNALLEGYRQDSDRGRIQTIRYANKMLENWPLHEYLASSVYLAGWSVLLADTCQRASVVGNNLDSWERYVNSLLTASYFFEMSARKDSSPDGFWTSAAGAPLGVIHEGFENVEALRFYLAAQRLSKITYLRTKDERTLIDAVKIMESIEEKYPKWARQYGVVVDKQETINAIAVYRTRIEEGQEIFGLPDEHLRTPPLSPMSR